jgi:GntR family transcriptional repressor for pyruvate dehydrogenase complex
MRKIKSDVYGAVKDAKASAVEWHTIILNAILTRDPLAAREAMEQHLRIVEGHIRKTYGTQQLDCFTRPWGVSNSTHR